MQKFFNLLFLKVMLALHGSVDHEAGPGVIAFYITALGLVLYQFTSFISAFNKPIDGAGTAAFFCVGISILF